MTTVNKTADMVSGAIYNITSTRDKMLRISSSDKEDIFNVVFKELEPYTTLHKLVYDD